jgi:diketogulonate reductase-like aldo/keto reductase
MTMKRSDISVISKLYPRDMTSEQRAFDAVTTSWEKMKMIGYIDIYLIHWPVRLTDIM